MSALDPVRTVSFGDILREHARSRPSLLAVVDGDVRLTFAELDERVNRLCGVLAAEGVGTGANVVWFGQTSFRVFELLLACAKLGAQLCPMNWRSSVEEARFVLDDLTPRVVVWQDEEIGVTARAVMNSAATWIRHDSDEPDSYEARLSAAEATDPDVLVDPSSGLLVIYTAAFGGRPNGAVLDHNALLVQGLTLAIANGTDVDDVFLNSGPLFHIATWMWAIPTFLLGGTNVYVRRTDAEELCRVIEAEHCTGAFLMPPTIDAIVECNADGRYDLSSLRTPSRGPAWDAMVSPDTSRAATRRGGYGQTEVTGLGVMAAFAPGAIGTAGRPAPLVSVRIVDPDGNDVPPGETGEILVRGATVTAGYYNRPELNAQRRAGGWHHTNDLGRREADGSITFVGPKTRLIKSAAENIYPAEVENCIKTHPAVADAAVIGVPDPTWSQRVKALVVVKPDSEVTADAIVEHCRERIASYKKPSIVEFVEVIPRVNGAVDYDTLDAQYGGGGYPGTGG